MRRKRGTLLPLEVAILAAGLPCSGQRTPGFHGFEIAKAIQQRNGARLLTAHGTLYKALRRMERAGLLESEWEDPEVAITNGRPRRRLYRVTGLGKQALANAQAAAEHRAASRARSALAST